MGKILVAEDSLIVNQHIKHALESGSHEVVSVYSGKEAVKMASEQTPDLILMDIMMETNSDGIDAAFEIKQNLDIPIIFLTALTDEPTIEKAKFSLPYGYVVKPFNEAELLSNIDVALYKAQAEKKIKENSELFQAIINSIDKAIFLLDEEGIIRYTNSIVEHITARPFEQLMNQNINQVLDFKDYESGQTVNVVGKEEVSEFELLLDGNERIYGDFYSHNVSLDEEYTLFFFKDISERVRIREVNEEMKNRRLLSFIEGQEKERERIARDLHDGVGQIANMIKLAVKKGDSKEVLTDMLDQFLDEMRKVTDGLLPSLLSDFPIDVCIKKIVDQADKTSEIQFSFQAGDLPDLDMKLKVNIYRITQENISNIIKHSQANNASIQLYGFDDHIQMTIEDDGVGFEVGDYTMDTTHHGIQNILFRSQVLKAECNIDTQKGKGTFISLKIPIE
ncbi:PAS domain S-box-containing protein [Ekhidna lutea]|uniref:histidine kinase n=1 Tax=Ekhidna lutea TaxID=447679 RepID=A0A239KL70_EKHLU|nr:response regulator [Ekhidna lutea]SNT18438.1 PAS domain S-box-containing protein [Ekhidna lutea]